MDFLTQQDFDVQIREEILSILQNDSDTALSTAERMAIDQIKQYIGSRYDMLSVFSQTENQRDHFIIMITIDLLLYHLYSKKAPRRMPDFRSQRYQDALDWLQKVATGKISAQFPQLPSQQATSQGIISSIYPPSWNKY